MNTVSLSDLMRELQAGEEARVRVPQLEAYNTQLTADINKANQRNMGLEENIVGYKRTIEELSSKVRSLEVERDDAGFRELEAQDKLNTLLNTIRGSIEDLAKAEYAVNPPKPVEPASPAVSDASVPMTEPSPSALNVPITEGERATDPTVQSAPVVSENSAPNTANPDATSPEPYQPFASQAPVDPTPPSPPYLGLTYHSKPDAMTWETWVAGGGEKPHWL